MEISAIAHRAYRGQMFLEYLVARNPLLLTPLYFKFTIRQEGHRSYKLRLRPRAIFKEDYDLIVDGFRRSGNTFLAEAIRLANPGIRIRSHSHNPVYLTQAKRWKRPAIVLIRNPEDAIASYILHSRVPALRAIEQYIMYYRVVAHLKDNLLLVDFKQLVQNPSAIAEQLKEKYSITIQLPLQSKSFQDSVNHAVLQKPWGGDFKTSSVPEPRRFHLLEEQKRLLLIGPQRERIMVARKIYHELLRMRCPVEPVQIHHDL